MNKLVSNLILQAETPYPYQTISKCTTHAIPNADVYLGEAEGPSTPPPEI